MFGARFFLFRLHESPRYLASQQKSEAALAVLKNIAAYNAHPLRLELRDVELKTSMEGFRSVKTDEDDSFESQAVTAVGSVKHPAPSNPAHPGISSSNSSAYIDFSTAREYGTPPLAQDTVPSNTSRTVPSAQGSFFHTPSEELGHAQAFPHLGDTSNMISAKDDPDEIYDDEPHLDLEQEVSARKMDVRHFIENGSARLRLLFVPEWKRTTILMWLIWGLMSLAYGM
jgi:hypothetical protein